jgi:putative ABC transport system permease protein
MIHELRHVLRTLLRRKGFASMTVLTLGLGIGSAASIYSVVAWHLFRGPPAPDGVYMLGMASSGNGVTPYLPPVYAKACASMQDVFAGTSLALSESKNIVVDKENVSSSAVAVDANFFGLLNAKPAMGRAFSAEECTEGRDGVAVVSYRFWKGHLGGMPDALGRRIRVGGDVCTVVGVMRKGQRLPVYCDSDVFQPFVLREDPKQPLTIWLLTFASLKPGVGRAQADAAIAGMKPDLPEAMRFFYTTVKPSLIAITDAEKFLGPELYWTLVGAVGFLYAIACLNATNLMLVHLLGRRREISVRAALGGSRWGITRLVLIETVSLSAAGTGLGALFANWLTPLFYVLAGNGDPEHGWLAWNLGSGAYGVLAGLSLATALLTGAVPAAFLLRANILEGLKGGAGAVGENRWLSRMRGAFVVLQAALAVILLVGAGLMVRTFQRLEHLRLGFEAAHRVKMQVNIPAGRNYSNEKQLAALDGLREALLRIPGVVAAAYSSNSLLSGYDASTTTVKGQDGSDLKVSMVYSSPDYAFAGGLTLLSGRWPAYNSKGDVAISETLARKRFSDSDPIGQYVSDSDSKNPKMWHVVGVIADVRESIRKDPTPCVYLPAQEQPGLATSFLLLLGAEPDGKMLARLKQAVFANNPDIVAWRAVPLDKLLDTQLYNERLTFSVLRVLSGIALSLTIVGLYSIIAYSVDRRMGEFGIRMAVGATPGSLTALVLKRGVALTAIGLALGVAGALALTRFIRSLLFEAPTFDAVVVAVVVGLLFISCVLACMRPALKASKPDLATLLKQPD